MRHTIVSCFLSLLIFGQMNASHFRGGIITW